MGARLTGMNNVQANIRALESRMKSAQEAAVREGCYVVLRKAKQSLDSPGTPPLTRTGNLKRKTKLFGVVTTATDVVGYVGSIAVYAPRLEYGFFGVDKIGRMVSQPPYPFLRPALYNNRKEVNEAIQAKLRRAMK